MPSTENQDDPSTPEKPAARRTTAVGGEHDKGKQNRVQTHCCSQPRELRSTCWPTVVEGAAAEDGMATPTSVEGCPAAEQSLERTGEAGLRIRELAFGPG